MRLVLLEESATECNTLFRLRLHTAQRYFDFRFRLQVEYVQEAASPTSSQSEEAAASSLVECQLVWHGLLSLRPLRRGLAHGIECVDLDDAPLFRGACQHDNGEEAASAQRV